MHSRTQSTRRPLSPSASRTSLVTLLGAILAACEATSTVGSTCPNGACPLALTRTDDPCLVSSTQMSVAFRGTHDQSFALCLPEDIARTSSGTIDARLVYVLPDDDGRCADRTFLRPIGDDLRARYARDGVSREVCEVNQLSVTRGDGGLDVAAGDGFYYDDASAHTVDSCPAPRSIRFTKGAVPWDGVELHLLVLKKEAADGSDGDALTCEALPGTASVGESCVLQRSVYDDRQVILETRSDACGGGTCMAYQLLGSTDGSCLDECAASDSGVCDARDVCAPEDEIERRVYCTCRCDAPAGASDACTCPDGFECVPTLAGAGAELDGSYCVKSGTFVRP